MLLHPHTGSYCSVQAIFEFLLTKHSSLAQKLKEIRIRIDIANINFMLIK